MVDLFGRGRLSFSDMLKNLSVARKTAQENYCRTSCGMDFLIQIAVC